jgi:hypothetical protein
MTVALFATPDEFLGIYAIFFYPAGPAFYGRSVRKL